MDFYLHHSALRCNKELRISGSKSETNRLLLLQALYPQLIIENASDSDDSIAMRNALQSSEPIIDIGHAGTAMRFLTAYFALRAGRDITLTGSERMKQRPIGILVDALTQLGAEIAYVGQHGYPPIRITGRQITSSKVTIAGNVSSQYVSALLLMAPSLPNGLEVTLTGEITSRPYIDMTLSILNSIGVQTSFSNNIITVFPHQMLTPTTAVVESDWSSASYYYSIVALSPIGTQISLSSYKRDSIQGDSELSKIYESFGVRTEFDQHKIILIKESGHLPAVAFDLQNTPDIAQTIAVTCLGLGSECKLTGLHTLQIKETDRLVALQTELQKLGGKVTITSDSLMLMPEVLAANVKIFTYDDHRMAMAFAPLAVMVPIVIENAEVVSKSYPAFWDDLKSIGFMIDSQP